MATQVTSKTPVTANTDEPVQNKHSFGFWLREYGWRHLVGVVVVIYALVPIIYIISASLNPGGTLTGSNQLFQKIDFENYQRLGGTRFWHWMGNSLVIAISVSVGTVLMAAAAAYAFSRFRFTGRRVGLTSLLIIQMFPQMLAFVAIFLLLLNLGDVVPILGVNSTLALIAVYLGGALGVNTFLLYGFFNTIPKELDEAAKIDGLSHGQIYWQIILRLAAPILSVVALLSFISTFGEFVIARVVLQQEENWTVAIGLYSWVASRLDANWGQFAAGAIIASIPILLLFLFLQKYIVGGLTAGAVKG
ncbi:sugar ABC transporter permease [Actinomyces minihominis]|uniref:sugar ABC transporter permease n=1 Tax=Actinomyces minihominis TaxID=2002838 RepID=UPI000C0743BE|nr:sugar ABC transporter permease [Actinomyces minihominis]